MMILVATMHKTRPELVWPEGSLCQWSITKDRFANAYLYFLFMYFICVCVIQHGSWINESLFQLCENIDYTSCSWNEGLHYHIISFPFCIPTCYPDEQSHSTKSSAAPASTNGTIILVFCLLLFNSKSSPNWYGLCKMPVWTFCG